MLEWRNGTLILFDKLRQVFDQSNKIRVVFYKLFSKKTLKPILKNSLKFPGECVYIANAKIDIVTVLKMSPKQTFFKNIAHIYLLSFCSNFDVKINHYICSVCVAFARLHITDLRFWFCAGDHSFSTQANFFEKVTFLPPDTQTYVCVSMANKCFFFGKLCVRTKWMTPNPDHVLSEVSWEKTSSKSK